MDDLPHDERRASRFLLSLLGLLAVVSLLVIWPFLTGTLFAVIVGLMLQPAMRKLTRIVRYKWLAGSILLTGVIAVVVVPLSVVGIELFQDGRDLVERASEGGYDATIIQGLVNLGASEEAARAFLTTIVDQGGAVLRATALPTLTALGLFAANVGIFIFLTYFVLVDADDLLRVVRRALPLLPARREHLILTIEQRVRVLFLGTFLVAFVQGLAAALGWWILGFPNVVFWGFVMTILAVIPAVGPGLIMVPAGVIAMLQGETFAGAALVVWAIVVVGLIDNITRPFIVGRGTGVHPGLVLLGTLGGLAVLGPTGFILGPLILSMVTPILDEFRGLDSPSPPS